MGLVYEKIVEEDFNRGYGTVDVTMPAGGTAVGSKTGLHTWMGGWVNVKDFGAIGDGSVNDAAAIQAALDTNLNVYLPFGDFNIGTTTLTPYQGQTIRGAGIGGALTFRSRLLYSGNGSAIVDTHAVNSSGYAQITIEDLYIFGSGAASTGAGIELLAGGFAYYTIRRCRVGGTFKYGIIADGIEVSQIYENILENGQGVTGSAHIWIVNGDDRRSGQAVGFSNVISIVDNQLNGADYGVIDDGGNSHRIVGNNFNGNSVALTMAGATDFTIHQNNIENADRITGIANILFQDRSTVGGGASTTDKGPCRAGTVTANHLGADMISGSSSPLTFSATTVGAYHTQLFVVGNILGNQLGRSAGINVTSLGRSFVAYNADDATGAHFTGQHNTDAYANTLIPPGGTADSVTGGQQSLYGELTNTKTWNPGLLADGAVASTTVTVTGALVVDVATASHDAIGANDVIVSAHVQAADTVRIVIRNVSGGNVTIGSGISRVFVKKPI